MPSVLIADAGNGIGIEFARQYAEDGWETVAACGNSDAAGKLTSIGKNISILPFDASDDASLAALTKEIGATPLDVVILNATADVGRERLVSEIKPRDWMERSASTPSPRPSSRSRSGPISNAAR